LEAKARAKVSVRALVVLALVAICVYALDQITKFLVVKNLPKDELVHVFGQILQFQYVRNPGAAFSIGSGSTWIFSIIGIAVLVFVIWYAPRIRSTAWAVLFGLLLGGLLGNLTDRLFREPGFGVGHVVDFIRIPLLPAIFNLADTAIVSSTVLFLILTLLGVGLDGKRHVREDGNAKVTVGSPDSADSAEPSEPSGTADPEQSSDLPGGSGPESATENSGEPESRSDAA
jgi:signal peptidase II